MKYYQHPPTIISPWLMKILKFLTLGQECFMSYSDNFQLTTKIYKSTKLAQLHYLMKSASLKRRQWRHFEIISLRLFRSFSCSGQFAISYFSTRHSLPRNLDYSTFSLSTQKSGWDLVSTGQNGDVRRILTNLFGLRDWCICRNNSL